MVKSSADSQSHEKAPNDPNKLVQITEDCGSSKGVKIILPYFSFWDITGA